VASRWVTKGAALLGSAELQSLADLGNSFEIIQKMNVVPFTKRTVLQLAVITLVPVAPLLLTMVSLEKLITDVFQDVCWRVRYWEIIADNLSKAGRSPGYLSGEALH
jgi:hypothetical protein